MEQTLDQKISNLQKKFNSLPEGEARYNALIELGRGLEIYAEEKKTPEYLVKGCQSTLYVWAEKRGSKIYFNVWGDALISAGLAGLLLAIYNGESAETIVRAKPAFLNELGLNNSLSPNRSNGLQYIFLKMQQLALQFLLKN